MTAIGANRDYSNMSALWLREALMRRDAELRIAYSIKPPVCVFQDWVLNLPSLQQQSVLVLALRGPDGLAKTHPCKFLIRRYRASVVKSARHGRAILPDEAELNSTFQSLENFTDDTAWAGLVDAYFKNSDDLPLHHFMHLLHGAEIIGYKHPDLLFQDRWRHFYRLGCEVLHLNPEAPNQMDERLNDWERKHWGIGAELRGGHIGGL